MDATKFKKKVPKTEVLFLPNRSYRAVDRCLENVCGRVSSIGIRIYSNIESDPSTLLSILQEVQQILSISVNSDGFRRIVYDE